MAARKVARSPRQILQSIFARLARGGFLDAVGGEQTEEEQIYYFAWFEGEKMARREGKSLGC